MISAQTWDLSYQTTDLRPSGTSPARSNAGCRPDAARAAAELPADWHCRVILTPVLESARLARDFTRAALADWQLDGLAYEAITIASELVTNAIRHGVGLVAPGSERAGVGLAWQRHASRLVCVVTDQSMNPPVVVSPNPDAESGRGLQVVQALATAWGWMMLSAHEKAVWAALLLPAAGLVFPASWLAVLR